MYNCISHMYSPTGVDRREFLGIILWLNTEHCNSSISLKHLLETILGSKLLTVFLK